MNSCLANASPLAARLLACRTCLAPAVRLRGSQIAGSALMLVSYRSLGSSRSNWPWTSSLAQAFRGETNLYRSHCTPKKLECLLLVGSVVSCHDQWTNRAVPRRRPSRSEQRYAVARPRPGDWRRRAGQPNVVRHDQHHDQKRGVAGAVRRRRRFGFLHRDGGHGRRSHLGRLAVRLLVGPRRGARHSRQRTVIFRHSIPTRGAELAPRVAPAAVASGVRPGLALRVLRVPTDVSSATSCALWSRCLGAKNPTLAV